MQKEPIEQLFNRLGGELDTASPSATHKSSFLAKLEAQKQTHPLHLENRKVRWMRPLFIAASMLLIAGLIVSQIGTSKIHQELADVSPEMRQTQDFFTKTIERELFEIKENITPENEKMVLDALNQLQILELDYDELKNDLSESGEDKRVIYAMINNFQNRIDLLQTVVEHMDAIKKINTQEEAFTL